MTLVVTVVTYMTPSTTNGVHSIVVFFVGSASSTWYVQATSSLVTFPRLIWSSVE
jgi:hypothetical protein